MKSRRNTKPAKGPSPRGNKVQNMQGMSPVNPVVPGPQTDHSTHVTADLSPETQAYAMGGGMGGRHPFMDTDQDGQ